MNYEISNAGFQYISENEFTKKALVYLLDKTVKYGNVSYDFRYFSDILTRVRDHENQWNGYHNGILAERFKSGTVQVMSDIWETETYREILVFGQREAGKDRGLFWVRDGSHTFGCTFMFDENTTYFFHQVAPISDACYEDLCEWLNTKAGVEEATGKAQDAANRVETVARTVNRGAQVEVVKGRKVKIGTKGIAAVVCNGNFGWRVGISTDGAKDARGMYTNLQWTSLDNVAAVVDEKALEASKKATYAETFEVVKARIVKEWETTLEKFGVANPVAARKLAKQ